MRLKAPFKRKVSDGPPNSTPARSKDFPPINNSICSFGRHIPSHHREVLQSKESRRQSLTKTFHSSFSHSMRRIQQPSDSRTLVKSGPCLMNFATHCGGYIVSLCYRSSSQQLARFLNSRPLSTKTFRRGWSKANWLLFNLTQISALIPLRT